MHNEILTREQSDMFPKLKVFSKHFGLIGGTAIALQIGHRQSLDFDLASLKELDRRQIRKSLQAIGGVQSVLVDKKEELTVIVRGIKFTFINYPFHISFAEKAGSAINTPDLLTLASMKAYTLGRRAKWKDYVDLFFIIKKYRGIAKIVKKAKEIFGPEFNEKIFRTQLAYFKDIDRSEDVIYAKGREVSDKVVERELTEFSLKMP